MFALNVIHSIRANRKCSTRLVALINSTRNTECKKDRGDHFLSIKGARYERFFVCAVIILLPFLSTKAHSDPEPTLSCSIGSSDETVEINHIIDGDTVILKDGRHVRLIGIDTPEIGRDGRKSDAGAESARSYLVSLVQGNKNILLKFDSQRLDRYKRTLAHLFLPNGQNIQAILLAEGLATPLTIPPNLKFLNCYLYHSNHAVVSQQGLWRLKQYKPISSTTLHNTPGNNNTRGYRVIIGKVEHIGESRSSIWINLTGNIALRIKREDLSHFRGLELLNLEGKRIQARGWIYRNNNEFRIRIRHGSDIMLVR